MSFEGYDRVLCENGHLFECDVYAICETDLNDPNWKCPICGKPKAWSEVVDMTNGIKLGEKYQTDLEISEDPNYKQCPTCGHVKIIEPVKYKIPIKNYDKIT